jgi:hypothetical protein
MLWNVIQPGLSEAKTPLTFSEHLKLVPAREVLTGLVTICHQNNSNGAIKLVPVIRKPGPWRIFASLVNAGTNFISVQPRSSASKV